MTPWPVKLVSTALMLIGLLQATVILAQPVTVDATLTKQCPTDKPFRIEIETGTMSCTSAMCLGRVDCGSGVCKISRDYGDSCNTCTMRTYVACLSEQDLKAIRR